MNVLSNEIDSDSDLSIEVLAEPSSGIHTDYDLIEGNNLVVTLEWEIDANPAIPGSGLRHYLLFEMKPHFPINEPLDWSDWGKNAVLCVGRSQLEFQGTEVSGFVRFDKDPVKSQVFIGQLAFEIGGEIANSTDHASRTVALLIDQDGHVKDAPSH